MILFPGTTYRCTECQAIVLVVLNEEDFSQQELDDKAAAHDLREHSDMLIT